MPTAHPAEAEDRRLQLVAWGVLAMGLKFAADAAAHLASEAWATWLDRLALGLALLALLLILPVFASKFRPAAPGIVPKADGFAASMLRQSQASAMNAALLALVLLEIASKRFPELPSSFFLELVLAILLGTLATKFLFLGRATPEA